MIIPEVSAFHIGIIGAIALLLGWHFIQKRREAARLASLGAKPVQVPNVLPFGIDLVWEAITVCVVMVWFSNFFV